MEQQTQAAEAATHQIIRQIITAWAGQNKLVTDFFGRYNESVYLKDIAPGLNRPVYILGHLVAVSDSIIPMFGLGKRLFPELEPIFIITPDKTVAEIPSIAVLKEKWAIINETLSDHFQIMSLGDWMDRHMSVSVADFELNPMRNKLNVLISRTIHIGYHMGQLNLVKG